MEKDKKQSKCKSAFNMGALKSILNLCFIPRNKR